MWNVLNENLLALFDVPAKLDIQVDKSCIDRAIDVKSIVYPSLLYDGTRLRFFITCLHTEERIQKSKSILLWMFWKKRSKRFNFLSQSRKDAKRLIGLFQNRSKRIRKFYHHKYITQCTTFYKRIKLLRLIS